MQNVELYFKTYAGISANGISAEDADVLLTHVLSSEDIFQLVFDNWNLLEPALRDAADRSVFWLFEACITLKQRWGRSPVKADFRQFLAGYLVSRTAYGDHPAEYLELPFDRCVEQATEGSEPDGLSLASRCIESAALAESQLPLIVDSSAGAAFRSDATDDQKPTSCGEAHEPRFSSLTTDTSRTEPHHRVLRPSVLPMMTAQKHYRQLDAVVCELQRLNVIETEIINQNDPIIAELAAQILADPRLGDVPVLILTDRPRHETFCTVVANLSGLPQWVVEGQLSIARHPHKLPSFDAIGQAESIVKEWCYSSRLKILSHRLLTRESADARILPIIKQMQAETNCAHIAIFIDSNSLWGDPAFEGIGAYADAMQCILRLADLSNGYSIVTFTGQKLAHWRRSECRSAKRIGERVSIEIQNCDRVLTLKRLTSIKLKQYFSQKNSKSRGRQGTFPADECPQFLSLAVTHGPSTRKNRQLVLEIDHDRARVQIARRNS